MILPGNSTQTTWLFLRLVRLIRFWILLSKRQVGAVLLKTLSDSFDALLFILVFSVFCVVILGFLVYAAEAGRFKVTDAYPEGAFMRSNSLSYGANAEEPSPFTSIPVSMYFIITTMTTG